MLLYRRLLYSIFIIAFLIIAPILALYATGYRYNFSSFSLEKTGILVVESIPRGATVMVNGTVRGKTPLRLSRLLPDNYEVRVSYSGYHSWQQKITVESNRTTFANGITLFKDALPINIIEGDVQLMVATPDRTKLLYSRVANQSESLHLYNVQNGNNFNIKLFPLRQNTSNLSFTGWSADGSKALLKQTTDGFNTFIIVDIFDLKTRELFDITRLSFSDVEWDQVNPTLLYGLRQAVLHRIDILNNLDQAMLSANMRDFYTSGDRIYFIDQLGSESFLNVTAITNGNAATKSEKIKLPSPSQFNFLPSRKDVLLLRNARNSDIFAIPTTAFSHDDLTNDIILQDQAKDVRWSSDSSKLLYFSDFELSVLTLSNREKILLTRYGEVIDTAEWYPRNGYVIYELGDTIRVIETGASEMKNDLELVSLPRIDATMVNRGGTAVYFKGTAGAQQGIYRLELQ